MLGQERIVDKVNSYTLDTLPHSILLLGDRGSGQFELCEMIAKNLSLELFDLTKIENFKEFIDTMYTIPTPTLYTINLLEFNDPKDIKQNAMLKMFEEPNQFSYIIIYGEYDSHILETIRNRSYRINMDRYSKEQLAPIVKGDKDLVLSICNTPGQIEVANHTDIGNMFKLCNNIVENIGRANLSNTLTIADKINFKDEYDKYDLFLFIRCLGVCLRDKMLDGGSLYGEMYNLLNTMNIKVWQVLNRRQQLENFLVKLWELSRN